MYKKKKRNHVKYNTERTISLRKHKYRPLPVPEAGKRYHCFNDGKITFSRHYIIEVYEVLDFMQFKRKYPEMVKKYIDATKGHYWLYIRRTDKFVVAFEGENNECVVYIRTKDGSWFSISGWLNSAELDVTGKLWDNLVKHIDNFNYTTEQKKQLIEEGKI